jgi:hypothetical protein
VDRILKWTLQEQLQIAKSCEAFDSKILTDNDKQPIIVLVVKDKATRALAGQQVSR